MFNKKSVLRYCNQVDTKYCRNLLCYKLMKILTANFMKPRSRDDPRIWQTCNNSSLWFSALREKKKFILHLLFLLFHSLDNRGIKELNIHYYKPYNQHTKN